MTDKSKNTKLPGDLTSADGAPEEDEFDDFDDLEEWEIHAELLENEDYPALVKYCQDRAKRCPDDQNAQYELGEAYVLNGEFEKAIEFMSKHHKKHPENDDYHLVILDALFSLDKNEDDFDWIERPVVLRLSEEILDDCYKFLKPKKKPFYIMELHAEFAVRGYVLFTHEDLLTLLLADERFQVDYSGEDPYFAAVSVVRKKKE
jgi:tetratricopeptide (TPR) repeat protein